MKIIIAGITGQDGSLLYDYLKSKKFRVIDLVEISIKINIF